MTTIILTLFEFADRVARLREVQKHYQDIQSSQSQRIALALEIEVDGICQSFGGGRVSDELRTFSSMVVLMRMHQNMALKSKSDVLAAKVLRLEADVDNVLARAVRDAKALNVLLVDQD